MNKTETIKTIQKFVAINPEPNRNWDYMIIKMLGKRTFKIIEYGNGSNWNFDDLVIHAENRKITLKNAKHELNHFIEMKESGW